MIEHTSFARTTRPGVVTVAVLTVLLATLGAALIAIGGQPAGREYCFEQLVEMDEYLEKVIAPQLGETINRPRSNIESSAGVLEEYKSRFRDCGAEHKQKEIKFLYFDLASDIDAFLEFYRLPERYRNELMDEYTRKYFHKMKKSNRSVITALQGIA